MYFCNVRPSLRKKNLRAISQWQESTILNNYLAQKISKNSVIFFTHNIDALMSFVHPNIFSRKIVIVTFVFKRKKSLLKAKITALTTPFQATQSLNWQFCIPTHFHNGWKYEHTTGRSTYSVRVTFTAWKHSAALPPRRKLSLADERRCACSQGLLQNTI